MKRCNQMMTVMISLYAIGCGDVFSKDETQDKYTVSQIFFKERAAIICEKNEKCCTQTGVKVVSAATCLDRASWERYGSWFDDDLEAGYSTLEESRVNGCLSALESLTCKQWSALIEGEPLNECLGIYVARQNEGDKCEHDEACKTHHCRELPEVDGERPGYGICDLRTSEGEECYSSSEVSQDCESGQICYSSSIWTTDSCAPLLRESDACSSNKLCYGGTCDSETNVCGITCQMDPDDRSRNVLRHW